MISRDQVICAMAYDPDTGVFTWRENTRGHRAGTVAGSIRWDGYRDIYVGGRKTVAHRLAWLYVHGEVPEFLDHVNGQRDDNRIANLRPATRSQNQQNIRAPLRNNKAGMLGVCLNGNRKWQAQIGVNGRQMYLGQYATHEEAHAVYLAAKARLHPYQTIVRGR